MHSLSIGRERNKLDRTVKVEMMKNHSSPEINQQRSTIYCVSSKSLITGPAFGDFTFINTEENIRIGAQSDGSDVLAIFERERKGLVS